MTTQAPLPSGFGMRSTASDVLAGIDLAGRNVIVTGGYSGIGVETTRALAAAGAHVTVPARTPQKARAALAGLANVELARARPDGSGIHRRLREQLAGAPRRTAYPRLQCSDHGFAARARQPRLREPVRHQSPRAFPAALPPVAGAGGSPWRASRHALLARASHHADELRRPQLRAPRVPQVVRLRPGEDREQPVRARRGRARPRAGHPCIRRAPGRDHDRPAAFAAARGTGRHGLDHGRRRREPALQDHRARRGHHGVGRYQPATRGTRRPVLRRLRRRPRRPARGQGPRGRAALGRRSRRGRDNSGRCRSD